MKKIAKFLLVFLSFLILPSFASPIGELICETSIDSDATVAIAVYDILNKKELYLKNEKKLLNPASILKTFTFGASYRVLGANYKFETSIYKYNNDLYLKLSGDTLFSKSDLNKLIKSAKSQFDFSKIDNIYIDDTIFDKTPYPSSWMAEDMWPYQKLISPYIIDKNETKILIKRSSLSTKVDIIQNDDFRMPIINKLTLFQKDADNKITIKRLYGDNSPIIEFSGDINKDITLNLPVNNPELNFKIKFKKELEKNNIYYDKFINNKKLPKGAKKLTSISHSIEEVSKNILWYSNNIDSETVFRVAASKYYSKTATFEDAKKMFFEVFKNTDEKNIKLSDASGVSRQNLISAKTAAELFKDIIEKNPQYLKLMMSPNQGTLGDRLLFLSDNLKAKTGTLAGVSSLAATFKTYNNTDVIVISIIQNSQKRSSLLKDFENRLIAVIYRDY